jgi:uncharacterized Fe-S cluster-containing radical SAM superfamily protein
MSLFHLTDGLFMSSNTAATKFSDPFITADGSTRASVELTALQTLWFNTGTLCNLACDNCYIESTPTNDRLEYIRLAEVEPFLDEIQLFDLATDEIGLTGGEPFMNPDIIPIMKAILRRGFRLLVLTNAMRPMAKVGNGLLQLQAEYPEQLTLRVSVDHYRPELHEEERGAKSWQPMLEGLCWLSSNGFNLDVAGRTRWGDDAQSLRQGFANLFKQNNIAIDAMNHKQLVLFPEMAGGKPVPEITTACWGILDVDPSAMMCASSRMVVKVKGDAAPSVMACTLLAYDQQFNLGSSLAEASKKVQLNHPNCAEFCVLGGGSCSVSE